ncbi:MAG: hypothetical protein AAF755_04815 [Pseudomonadota bacterium]
MTALTKYARLEATGLWRATPDAQRREVIVSVGDATLIISDINDRALTHWSLAALTRANPGVRPALYHPDGDPGETLELTNGETEMIEAVETLRRAIEKSRPKPGRIRWISMITSFILVGLFITLWLPGALRDHALRVVPEVKREALGRDVLKQIERVSGPRCQSVAGDMALERLDRRLQSGPLAILPSMTRHSLHVPGNLILISDTLVKGFEEPDVVAGYVIAELTQRARVDPLHPLLEHVGLRETFRLLTTGDIAEAALKAYAERLMIQDDHFSDVDVEAQRARFASLSVRTAPYANARYGGNAEKRLALTDGGATAAKTALPLLSDADWLRLQMICTE